MSALTQAETDRDSMFREYREIEGAAFLYMDAPRPRYCGIHSHDQVLASFLLGGAIVEVDDRGQKSECGPLTLHTTPPGMRHAHLISSPRVTTLCIAIEVEMLSHAGDAAKALEEPMTCRRSGIISLAPKIRREIAVGDHASSMVLEGLVLELVGELARKGESKLSDTAPVWLRRAKDMIHDHWNRSLSIGDVAAEAGVHPSQLNRAFRAYMNQTPGEYLRKVRMERATRQVLAGDLPLKAIATQAGFADQAHFTREFRRRHGVPPIEMRRMMRDL